MRWDIRDHLKSISALKGLLAFSIMVFPHVVESTLGDSQTTTLSPMLFILLDLIYHKAEFSGKLNALGTGNQKKTFI